MQAVPQREHRGPVGVRLLAHRGVVDAVHAGRDDRAHQPALEGERQPHARVVEPGGEGDERLERRRGDGPGSDDRDRERAVARAQQVLGDVEAGRRRHVEVEVGVVDEVEPPERGDAVHQPVPPVERVVEQHEGDERPGRARQPEEAEDAEAARRRGPRDRRHRRHGDEVGGRRRRRADGEVHGDAARRAVDPPAQRPAPLGHQQRARGEREGRHRQPEHRAAVRGRREAGRRR